MTLLGSRKQLLGLTCTFSTAFFVPLLSFLFNGAPLTGDSWLHMDLAADVIDSGHYSLAAYNERWPLVNLLLAFLAQVTGLSMTQTSMMIPLLAGLASIPLYGLCRSLGLPKVASAVAPVFLAFNPSYSYVTFAGAVMKETATFYLFCLLVAMTARALKNSPSKVCHVSFLLISLGVVFGHHYAGLVALLFVWALAGYVLFQSLRGESFSLHKVLLMVLSLTLPLFAWNLHNYLTLGVYFPVFNPTDALLLLAILVVAWSSLLKNKAAFSGSWPWLAAFAFFVSVAGLRTTLYLLAQPVPSISPYEIRDYLVTGAFAITGLAIGLKKIEVKALGAATVTLVLFAVFWGTTYPGYVLLIKSLHYYGPLLAIGAGFTASLLLRKGWTGRLMISILLIFTIATSIAGTRLALGGLSAYTHSEVEILKDLPFQSGLKILGDTRISYLLSYTSNIQLSGIKPLEDLGPGSLLILSQSNLRNGFLQGYDWVQTKEVLTHALNDRWSRLYHSKPLQVWLK